MMLLWFWFDLSQFLLPLFPAQLLHKVFFLSHHGVNTQILLKRVDDRHILAKFYHSYLLFPFLSSQRFFSFSSLTKAGSRRYILPENIRNSRIRFAVGYKHLSLEVYLTMSMHVMISYGPLYSCCQALPKILDICQNVQLLFLRVCSIPSIISIFCVLLPCCLCLLQFIIIGNTWLNNPVLECQIVWF